MMHTEPACFFPHLQYDELTSKHIDQLRQLTKQIQDARIARDNDAIKTSLEVGPPPYFQS